MMIMEAFHLVFDVSAHKPNREQKFSSHSFTSMETQPFDSKALESKLFLIGLNRLIIDKGQRCVNFPAK